jgi:3-phosphoshikimate 1-carboxyvinyltransferase
MHELNIPGDKSISHRAIIFASLSNYVVHIQNFLCSDDCLATVNALRAMGVQIDLDNSTAVVHGVGLHGLTRPDCKIDCGNSGTTMRLLAGILVAQSFESELVGDESLMQRPMQRIAEPLTLMGADIAISKAGTAPIIIKSTKQLQAIDYTLPVASAQVKSCLLLASLYAQGSMQIIEPCVTRDHTERMLQWFKLKINSTKTSQLSSKSQKHILIPSDISSAAFFIVAALLTKNNGVKFKSIGVNPTRTGLLTVLQKMGANIQMINQQFFGNEPVADLIVMPSQLHGIEINDDTIPSIIDEIPILAIAAACATGNTVIRGAKELRVKESDRIYAIVQGLSTLGIAVDEYSDGMQITGGKLMAGQVNSYADHRIAMAFSIAKLICRENIGIDNVAVISTSFPGYERIKHFFDNNITLD